MVGMRRQAFREINRTAKSIRLCRPSEFTLIAAIFWRYGIRRETDSAVLVKRTDCASIASAVGLIGGLSPPCRKSNFAGVAGSSANHRSRRIRYNCRASRSPSTLTTICPAKALATAIWRFDSADGEATAGSASSPATSCPSASSRPGQGRDLQPLKSSPSSQADCDNFSFDRLLQELHVWPVCLRSLTTIVARRKGLEEAFSISLGFDPAVEDDDDARDRSCCGSIGRNPA